MLGKRVFSIDARFGKRNKNLFFDLLRLSTHWREMLSAIASTPEPTGFSCICRLGSSPYAALSHYFLSIKYYCFCPQL
jgi:hypothetical protein